MRVLVLGGTGNIGPAHVAAALDRGHTVSVFSRGQTPSVLPAGIELLTGDRDGDLGSISRRDWDAVIDIAAFKPIWVRTLGEALRDRVGHYTLISTVSVYADFASNADGTDEDDEVHAYTEDSDPYSAAPTPDYGALKVLCEHEAERQFPGKTLVIRPTYIVGPGDGLGALTYWALRADAGGEILAAGDPATPVQWIDLRDMSEWVVRLAEHQGTGTFNAVGPAEPMTFGELVDAMRERSSATTTVAWVPLDWVAERDVPLFSNLLFWGSEAMEPGKHRISNARAVASGLTYRSLETTVDETLAWQRSRPPDAEPLVLLGGSDSLEASMARERELLREWHA